MCNQSLFTIMSPLPLLNEGNLSLIVRYSLDTEEEMGEAVVNAFLAAGLDVYDCPTTLVDWIDAEVFESLEWSSGRPMYLCTRIWGRRVVMTPEEVRIYTSPRNV